MKITALLLTELDQEAGRIRKTLQNVPEGKNDWKAHEKSMPLGNLATIVANIPAWLNMVVSMDESTSIRRLDRNSNRRGGKLAANYSNNSRTA